MLHVPFSIMPDKTNALMICLRYLFIFASRLPPLQGIRLFLELFDLKHGFVAVYRYGCIFFLRQIEEPPKGLAISLNKGFAIFKTLAQLPATARHCAILCLFGVVPCEIACNAFP